MAIPMSVLSIRQNMSWGHAIGLDHTDEKSVMQPAGSFYGIQEEDVANLENYMRPMSREQSFPTFLL